MAEQIIASGQADLVGLARVVWAGLQWPQKVQEGRENEVISCDPACEAFQMQLAMKRKPAYRTSWSPEKARKFKDSFRFRL